MAGCAGEPGLQIGLLLLAPFLLAAIIPGVLAPHSPDALLDAPFLARRTTSCSGPTRTGGTSSRA